MNPLDVSNFDRAFTNEEAIVSVVNTKDKAKINKEKNVFTGFC